MNRAWKRFLSAVAVTLVLVSSAASLAFASPAEGPNPRVVLAYIAGKTGTEMTVLTEEFKSGMTLEEICAAHGVDWSLVEDLAGPGREVRIQRLEEHIAKLLENQARVQEQLAKGSEAVAKLEERIAGMKDPALKGFAERHLDILQRRLALGAERLDLIGDRLELAQDMLEYAQSL
ncbi:MAG: hypothetical protein WD024_08530 [Bacillota bacterium]